MIDLQRAYEDSEPENCCPSCYTQTEDHSDECEYHTPADTRSDDAYEAAREARYG